MSQVKTITIESAIELIAQTNGSIFGVNFVKANGDYREMTCRLGVHKGLKGKGLTFDPLEHDLLTVFSMKDQDYRMVKLNTLYSLTVDGQSYSVIQ